GWRSATGRSGTRRSRRRTRAIRRGRPPGTASRPPCVAARARCDRSGRPFVRRMPCVRLPFYYGWLLVATAFITMGIGVNARTAFSLLFPPILGEFGWDRGVTAGAFSFGFLVSAVFSPLLGRLVDRRGPRLMLMLRRRPEDLGLLPDGDAAPRDARAGAHADNVMDPAWVAVDWTLPRALRTTRFWWVVVAYFCGLFSWYAVQVHQTKYLTE